MNDPNTTPETAPVTQLHNAIALGSVVRLASGGPLMTAMEIFADTGCIRCRWFWRGETRIANFLPHELVIVDTANEEVRETS